MGAAIIRGPIHRSDRGVNDLAAALADLAPFRVTSPPKDVTIYGYSGEHLELTVPALSVEEEGEDRRLTECIGGQLKSWVAPFDTVLGTRSTATRGPATARSSGSLTSKGPV